MESVWNELMQFLEFITIRMSGKLLLALLALPVIVAVLAIAGILPKKNK